MFGQAWHFGLPSVPFRVTVPRLHLPLQTTTAAFSSYPSTTTPFASYLSPFPSNHRYPSYQSNPDDPSRPPAPMTTSPSPSKTAELDAALHAFGFEVDVLSPERVTGQLKVTESSCQVSRFPM